MTKRRDPDAAERALKELPDLLQVVMRHGTPADRESIRQWDRLRQKSGLGSLFDEAVNLGSGRSVANRSALLSLAEFLALLPPAWLVDGWLVEGGFGCLYGEPGVGKSFVALDLAMRVATGGRWVGTELQRGPVVYVLAEGDGMFGQRTSAWCLKNGAQSEEVDLWLRRDVVNLAVPSDVEDLVTQLAGIAPVLVVFDTLARCMPGGDENSAKDMGRVIGALDLIRTVTGAAVLVVHHTGKRGAGERGSSALRGGADVMIKLVKQGERLRLEADKVKDSAPPDPLALRLVPMAGSLVVEGDGKGGHADSGTAPRSAQEIRDLKVLAVLKSEFGRKGTTAAKWERAANQTHGTSSSAFYRTRQFLLDAGLAANPQQGRRGTHYRLTPAGREAVEEVTPITSITPIDSDDSDLHSLPSPPPPYRGGVGEKAESEKRKRLSSNWDTDKKQEAR